MTIRVARRRVTTLELVLTVCRATSRITERQKIPVCVSRPLYVLRKNALAGIF
jgi:hypothetical protein